MNYTIAETYTLPSHGKIYGGKVSPTVKLRSMTVEEEMQRLSHSDNVYKTLCDIIDACMVEPIGISSYDMHIGDYQFLLHKLRVVTYGSNYPTTSICPICGRTNKTKINLDDLKTIELDTDEKVEQFNKLTEVELPNAKNKLRIRFQTPRDLDEIAAEERAFAEKSPDSKMNINYLYTLRHLVETVDGKKINNVSLDIYLRKLTMMDSNLIMQRGIKLNSEVGIDTKIENKCANPKCGAKYVTTFRITNEFFGPTDY